MQHFGIIGKPLGHSMSQSFFTARFIERQFDADYTVHELDTIDEVVPLLDSLEGMNVTSPYKEAIIPYLDEIDPVAREIGAVNVVSHRRGYNTDWLGVMEAIRPYVLYKEVHALILGTGGAARAVRYGLQQMNIPALLVSRSKDKGDLTYADLTQDMIHRHLLIANCTPLGMWPHENEAPPIPYGWITPKHVLFDCIYNPFPSEFLKRGRRQKAQTVCGLTMFLAQAEEAWKLFSNK